jgi:hypothetical protein
LREPPPGKEVGKAGPRGSGAGNAMFWLR